MVPPGKKWPTLRVANDNIHAHIVAAAHGRIHANPRARVTAAGLACRAVGETGFRFFTHCKRGGQLRPAIFEAVGAGISLPAGEIRKDIDGELLVLQEFLA